MKKIIYIIVVIAIFLTNALNINVAKEKKKLKIGGSEIVFQSPFQLEKDIALDTSEVVITVETVINDGGVETKTTKKRYPGDRSRYTDFYFGMGLATDIGFSGEKFYPEVQYGNSMELMTGLKFFYRPARWYAVGTKIQ